jgi:type III restriction enzyme
VTASLILNSPYAAPTSHWLQGKGGELVEIAGRRPVSYEIFDIRNNTRRSEPLERVNEIRGRVAAWCADVAFKPREMADILARHAA